MHNPTVLSRGKMVVWVTSRVFFNTPISGFWVKNIHLKIILYSMINTEHTYSYTNINTKTESPVP